MDSATEFLEGIAEACERIAVALERRPEYVDCIDCVFWKGDPDEITTIRGEMQPQKRECRRVPIPRTTSACHGCGSGLRRVP